MAEEGFEPAQLCFSDGNGGLGPANSGPALRSWCKPRGWGRGCCVIKSRRREAEIGPNRGEEHGGSATASSSRPAFM